VNANITITSEEEETFNRIIGKMEATLQTVRRGPRGEDEALERFLIFQPPIFVGEAEQNQKAEAWLESLENIFNVLQYSEESMIKFATYCLWGSARDWWIRVQEE
jgi:hypothetical protein